MAQCPEVAMYTITPDMWKKEPELLTVASTDSLVYCQLEKGHEGDHQFPRRDS